RVQTDVVLSPRILGTPAQVEIRFSRQLRFREGDRDCAAVHVERAGRAHGDRRHNEAGTVAGQRETAGGRTVERGRVSIDSPPLGRSRPANLDWTNMSLHETEDNKGNESFSNGTGQELYLR